MLRPLFCLTLLLALNTAAGEQKSDRTVPADIVEALLGLGQADAELLIGTMPDRLRGEVRLPPSARVDATLRRGGSETILLTIPAAPAAAGEMVRETLVAAGWTSQTEADRQREGFVTAIRPEILCKAGRRLWFSTRAERAGETRVSLHLEARRDGGGCSDARPSIGSHIPVPNLQPARGISIRGSSSGGGNDYRQTTVNVETDRPLDDLLDHYDQQIVEQGWSRRSKLDAPGAGMILYERTDGDENGWIGLLTGISAGQTSYRLSMTVLERKE